MNQFKSILKILDDAKVDYELIEHEKAVTSKQAEEITGWTADSGAKSILFKTKEGFLLVVVRGTNRVDFKKLREHLGLRKARLATPEEVLEVMGVEIGACYPFGEVAGVDTIVDSTLAEKEKITFSPGTHEHHIRIKWEDYAKLTHPKLVNLHLEDDVIF